MNQIKTNDAYLGKKENTRIIIPLLEQMITLLKKVIALPLNLREKIMFTKKTIVQLALEKIGTDASPNDLAQDKLGCAESVSTILNEFDANFPIITGTWTLWDILEHHPRFRKVTVPMPGTVAVCATGTGNGKKPGHTWILIGKNAWASNTSFGKDKGKWMVNYTTDQIIEFAKDGGFKLHMYQYN